MKGELEENAAVLPVGRLMALVTKSYYGALSRSLEATGIDRHFSLLLAIHYSKTRMTQRCLTHALDTDKVTMVRMLDYMMRQGMLTREVNPLDRREHFISLTARGKKIIPEVIRKTKKMNEVAFRGLSPRQIKTVMNAFALMRQNLDGLPVNPVDITLKRSRK